MSQSIVWLQNSILEADKPTITLLIGVPGSGKSTWTKNNTEGMTIVSSDDILEGFASHNGITYAEAWKRYHGEAETLFKEDLRAALLRGDHIIVDRTNMSKSTRNKILSQVPKSYLKYAALFQAERAEIDRRLTERAERTGKVIGAEIVEDMLSRYESPTRDEFDEIFV